MPFRGWRPTFSIHKLGMEAHIWHPRAGLAKSVRFSRSRFNSLHLARAPQWYAPGSARNEVQHGGAEGHGGQALGVGLRRGAHGGHVAALGRLQALLQQVGQLAVAVLRDTPTQLEKCGPGLKTKDVAERKDSLLSFWPLSAGACALLLLFTYSC